MKLPRSETASALFYIHLSNVLFAVTALFIAALSGHGHGESGFSGYFTSFVRFAVGAAFGFGHLAALKKPFKIHKFKPWLGRGIFGSLAMTLYYIAIGLGSAGRASLLNNTFPIFVAIIAVFALRESVRPVTVIGILFAFAGVALVLADGSAPSLAADAIGLASGILGGISYHFNKRATRTEHPIVIYLAVCLVGMAFNAFSIPEAARLDLTSAALLVLAGLGAYFAQVTVTIGLGKIDATAGSVHTFAKIPITIVGGMIAFGNSANGRFVFGTALLAAGILLDKLVPPRKNPEVPEIPAPD